MDQWYYKIEGNVKGPITEKRLLKRIASGRLKDADLICSEGMKDFVSVREYRNANPQLIEKAAAKFESRQRRKREAPNVLPDLNPKVVAGSPEHDAAGNRIQVQTRNLKDRTHSQLAATKRNRMPLIVLGFGIPIILIAGFLVWFALQSEQRDDNRSPRTASTTPKNSDRRNSVVDEATSPDPSTSSGNSTSSKISKSSEFDNAGKDSSPRPLPKDIKPAKLAEVPERNQNPKSIAMPGTNTEPTEPITKHPTPETEKPKQKDPPKPQTNKRIGLANTDTATLYQTIEVDRRPKFIVQGLPFDQQLNYVVESEIKVGKVDGKGFREVLQTVTDAKLIDADAMSKTAMDAAIKKLPGQTFTYKLNSLQEVIDFKPAERKEPESIEVEKPLGILDTQGLRITNVIDEDGWHELAQLTFFVPKQQKSWQAQMQHDWDSLGSWEGITDFKKTVDSKEIQQVDYVLHMSHTPASAEDASDLPFEIDSIDFASETSGGTIRFDPRLGRIESVTETFQVSGELESSFLGQKSKIQIKEKQTFTIRLSEQRAQ